MMINTRNIYRGNRSPQYLSRALVTG